MTDNDLAKLAINKLIILQAFDDTERAHGEADNVLCQLLSSLGFDEVVIEYYKIDKWYA